MKKVDLTYRDWNNVQSPSSRFFQPKLIVCMSVFLGSVSCSQERQSIALRRPTSSAENASKYSLCPKPPADSSAQSASLVLVSAKCSSCHGAGATAPDLSSPENITAA